MKEYRNPLFYFCDFSVNLKFFQNNKLKEVGKIVLVLKMVGSENQFLSSCLFLDIIIMSILLAGRLVIKGYKSDK